MSLRSPLGRVLGLGTSGGTHHWWMQRLSALALAPLGAWLAVALVMLPDHAYGTVHAWLARPVHALLMLLLVPAAAYHSWLGVTVVVEDYVHHPARKLVLLVALQFAHLALGAAALLAVLRVALGGAP